MLTPPTLKNICGAVVTYHPDKLIAERFKEIAHQLTCFVIVDNGSSETERRYIRGIDGGNVDFIENPENLGVATALNQAASHARHLGCSWLITFDQDSVPFANLLDGLLEARSAAPRGGDVAMIGSNFVINGTNLLFFGCGSNPAGPVERETLITSGSLLSLEAYEELGPFRDDFFIDGVDSEYCLRLRRNGYRVFAACKPLMEHNLGSLRVERFLWKRPMISHHSALRRYYITRNALVIAKEYIRSEPRWILDSLRIVVLGLVAAMLLEKDKLRKFFATILGLFDAVRGRMGSCAYAYLTRDMQSER
jgi:rhamnosyltransferase